VSSLPTGKGVLLDTTIVVDHFRSANAPLGAFLRDGGTAYLPLTALGELFAGAHRVARRDPALRQIALLLNAVVILPPDEATAQTYGEIHGELARAGTPIPQNDIWIAALAREHGLPLATRDAHFAQVAGLVLLDWR